MAINFNTFFRMLDSEIMMDFLIPFILIFAVLFASLQKIKIFKEKKVNIILALVISLISVIPHVTNRYPPGMDVIEIMMNAIPQVAAVIIAIIMLFILLGLFFGEQKFGGATVGGWISIVCMGIIVWIFGASAGWWTGWRSVSQFLGTDAISLVIIVLVFGLIIKFITKEDTPPPGDKFMEKLGTFFGGEK